MSTDPRVVEAMRLHKLATRAHHVHKTLQGLEEESDRGQESVAAHTALFTYLVEQFKQAGDDFAAMKAFAENGAAEISCLTTSLAERENTVDRLETEVARLAAELEEARKDAGRARSMHPEAVKYVVLSSIGGELISQADVDMRVLNEICRRTGDGMQSLRRVRGALNEMYHLAAAMTKEKP